MSEKIQQGDLPVYFEDIVCKRQGGGASEQRLPSLLTLQETNKKLDQLCSVLSKDEEKET